MIIKLCIILGGSNPFRQNNGYQQPINHGSTAYTDECIQKQYTVLYIIKKIYYMINNLKNRTNKIKINVREIIENNFFLEIHK